MTTNEIMKMVTDEMKKNGANVDEISKMEICIQYICNAEFRKGLQEYIFNATYHKASEHQG